MLLFDYDGTLVRFAPHPRLALLPPETRRVLARLARVPGVHVGVVSGRSLANLDRHLGVPGLALSGTSGLEIRVGGRRLVPPGNRRWQGRVADVAARMVPAISGYRGAWVEKKPLGVALHYRALELSQRRSAVCAARRAIGKDSRWFIEVGGPLAVEWTPDVGWTKGAAVRKIVRIAAPSRPLVLFAGDSQNDAPAFAEVRRLGGLALAVGRHARGARLRLSGPAEVRGLIARLLAALDQVKR